MFRRLVDSHPGVDRVSPTLPTGEPRSRAAAAPAPRQRIVVRRSQAGGRT